MFRRSRILSGLPPERWLFDEFGGLGCEEEPSSEEIKVGAAVHGALQELETRDLPFGLPTAPRQRQRSPDGAIQAAILSAAGNFGQRLRDAVNGYRDAVAGAIPTKRVEREIIA